MIPALSGCAPGSGLPLLPPAEPGPYRLGPGDVLRITVFGQKQLSADYRVGASDAVDIPLLGPVRAGGRTAGGLARAIAALLRRRGMLVDPEVAVEVKNYRPFSILGEVNKPGQYPFEPGMTVLEAVALAGGFTYRAAESEVEVIRVRHGRARAFRAPADALIIPGDVIRVFERHF
ncbi:MAG TPA: polysaccharide biosynthesis/export family protein [Acidiphilium sp.]